MSRAAATVAREDVDRLVGGVHHDPHSVLGRHEVTGGVAIRALHPAAARAFVEVGGRSLPMERVHDGGLFELRLDNAAGDYRLTFENDAGRWTGDDPYRFTPTLGELDLHLVGEGRHRQLWMRLGARVVEHEGVAGTAFAVWAPSARAVAVASDASSWDPRAHPMRSLGMSGVWELFLPGTGAGLHYKFSVTGADGAVHLKADPMARAAEVPPATASVVERSEHRWRDERWMKARAGWDAHHDPMSIYEVHLGSWRQGPDGAAIDYATAGAQLAAYCTEMGFSHVELMPVMEHPFGGSWGYQVTGYYAPTSRFGDPDGLRQMIDTLHQAGVGVILDWVPAHFPRDEWALARFDGTALYEHEDPRRGAHPDWGTLIFNYGRAEVRNFLVANALYWLEEFHVDGLRVDAVASMLYLDYSRKAGQWVPNEFGGRENLEAIEVLREVNQLVADQHPGALVIAEESTAWGGVTRPASAGGLGFKFKWNMGWMHDTLDYFSHDPVFRRYHHGSLTFGLLYAWSEHFVLPLSHDEVVHGKGSLLGKMAGDPWRKLANLRALLAWMWAHPGKQLLFMGAEIGQEREWSHERALDWELLEDPAHAGVQRLVTDLNRAYRGAPALWAMDSNPDGFAWIDAGNADQNVFSFLRRDGEGRVVACIANLAPVARPDFRVGLPQSGAWDEVLNTDAEAYGGTNTGNLGRVQAEAEGWNGQPCSAVLVLPPLGVLWLAPAAATERASAPAATRGAASRPSRSRRTAGR
ncbi:MAG: 1,4-alpha-glucan branching enzyme [Chloroflexota bacterium]|nr:1,4-alpha-glucan branching enzyme [Chloroflexota bacterium]